MFVLARRFGSRCIAALILSLCVAAAPPLVAQEQFTVSSNHRPLVIPDDDANFPIESTLAVRSDLNITDVNVTLDIEHESIGDLEIDLFGPTGERVRLVDEVCDDRDDFPMTVLDDEAPQGIGEVCPPGVGPYRPDDDLDEYDDDFSAGLWTLVVEDTSDGVIGVLNGWSLEITGAFASAPIFSRRSVVSSASFQGGAVAVGEMASIFGGALGPAGGVVAQLDPETGRLPTELAGVQVFFDDQPAPLFFVSASQLNVQVPFEVAIQQNVNVRVEFADTGIRTEQVPVIAAGPAIFTLDGDGQGRAAARNPNGSINDSLNRVPRGQAISVFATGLGAVEPPVPSGAPAPADPLSRVVADVRGAIGGVETEVLFAGLAPNFVGLYQIDLLVPETVEPGRVVQVDLIIDNRRLENFVYISVE